MSAAYGYGLATRGRSLKLHISRKWGHDFSVIVGVAMRIFSGGKAPDIRALAGASPMLGTARLLD